MKKFKLIMLLILSPSLSHAFFCPTNFNQINLGDTLEQVKEQCGKPDKEEKKDAEPSVPQEWNYYIPQTVATSTTTGEQGTLKTSLTFDKDGKAINISVNGIGVGASTICGKSIQLGDTRDAVKAACGEPSFINKQQTTSSESANKAEVKKIVTYTYNSNPPVKLIFEDGKLLSKE